MMVSVSDEADISWHHKSGGWARSGEVSHTGSSKINFLWPLNPFRETKPLNWTAGEERQPLLTPRQPCMWILAHYHPYVITFVTTELMWSSAELWQSRNLPATRSSLRKTGCRHFVIALEISLSWRRIHAAFLIIVSPGTSALMVSWRGNWFVAAPHAVFNSISEHRSQSCLQMAWLSWQESLFTLRSGESKESTSSPVCTNLHQHSI